MRTIIWVLVNCNSVIEGKKIGKDILKLRLTGCYDITPRIESAFFWPPHKNKIQKARGCMLILETLPGNVSKLQKAVKKLHSDKLPFIGIMRIGVEPAYYQWLQSEIV